MSDQTRNGGPPPMPKRGRHQGKEPDENRRGQGVENPWDNQDDNEADRVTIKPQAKNDNPSSLEGQNKQPKEEKMSHFKKPLFIVGGIAGAIAILVLLIGVPKWWKANSDAGSQELSSQSVDGSTQLLEAPPAAQAEPADKTDEPEPEPEPAQTSPQPSTRSAAGGVCAEPASYWQDELLDEERLSSNYCQDNPDKWYVVGWHDEHELVVVPLCGTETFQLDEVEEIAKILVGLAIGDLTKPGWKEFHSENERWWLRHQKPLKNRVWFRAHTEMCEAIPLHNPLVLRLGDASLDCSQIRGMAGDSDLLRQMRIACRLQEQGPYVPRTVTAPSRAKTGGGKKKVVPEPKEPEYVEVPPTVDPRPYEDRQL
ncbi:hypothetical protein GF376_01955 [Candidatus Peregrinibacteria bacterium]|nr:hypothetical protein [Candidatus Peregrinibacteria bacterium]